VIYVQTNPEEHSALTSGSSVEVFGWTEPGTRIIVNGNELPVSIQGMFLEQFTLSNEEDKIIVKAINPKGSKEIIRDFQVK